MKREIHSDCDTVHFFFFFLLHKTHICPEFLPTHDFVMEQSETTKLAPALYTALT